MDTSVLTAEIEDALRAQLGLSGDDPAIAAAGDALLVSLAPAVERAVMRLAEETAGEVGAQLPGKSVGVELREGVPMLIVREASGPVTVDTDDLEARITLRLSENLKGLLEDAAGESGDSVNAYVVKTLTTKARERGKGRRYSGTIET
ncbi:MAG: DUF1778 domain-containing protein [Actinomycetota bacterium]